MAFRANLITGSLLVVLLANRAVAGPPAVSQFVPDQRSFWDNSKHWTTNFGPAYRDTDIDLTQLLPCYN